MLAEATKVGPVEIVSAIGAGSMGEGYRARDPRLNRDVAAKVLPASFASRPVGHLSSQVTSFSQNKFGNTGIHLEVVSSGGLALEEVLRKKQRARVLVSNRSWDELNIAVLRSFAVRDFS